MSKSVTSMIMMMMRLNERDSGLLTLGLGWVEVQIVQGFTDLQTIQDILSPRQLWELWP